MKEKKYTIKEFLKAAEIGEVSMIDAKHTVSLLNEAILFLKNESNKKNNIPNDPHEVSSVRCDLCGKEWIAVRPEKTRKLECPRCHNIVFYDNI